MTTSIPLKDVTWELLTKFINDYSKCSRCYITHNWHKFTLPKYCKTFDIPTRIYIYILSSTDCFVVSQLISVARKKKLESKPSWLSDTHTNTHTHTHTYIYIYIYCWIIYIFVWLLFQIFKFISNIDKLHTMVWFQIFLSKTNNLHTVVWFQVFLSNSTNLNGVVWP